MIALSRKMKGRDKGFPLTCHPHGMGCRRIDLLSPSFRARKGGVGGQKHALAALAQRQSGRVFFFENIKSRAITGARNLARPARGESLFQRNAHEATHVSLNIFYLLFIAIIYFEFSARFNLLV